ncbi:PAX3- and PAX7-binding protein 1-like isoform X1 [Lytechinus variegatus]|uniref:PAX3- and PAX7-binding protein 1-like isoform X1 n=1 Tax=Lytechinus variegatus TaxID=7654 RepID=UPI001BB23C91|nr:PAX3- and PAX7-binding protein 1-like isoform X1 [Lytechinus variegatus]
MMKKKRNIRQRGRTSDSDEERAEPVSTKGDQIPFLETDYHTQIKQLEKEKSNKKKEKSEKKKQGSSLLTFAYDEDDGEGGEVFKIKKSSHSRKQARKVRERQKQLRDEGERATGSPDIGAQKNGGGVVSSVSIKQEKDDIPRPIKTEVKDEKKEVVLNGMDAEAAALAQEDLEEMGKKTQFTGFMPGVIPNANLIHAARKRRQMARERGDFIPVDDTQRFQSETSRLVRDDDNDQSGSDSDEGRMGFTVKQQTSRQRVQEALNAGGLSPEVKSEEHEGHNEELERWEQEQIKKGTSVPQVMIPQYQMYAQLMAQPSGPSADTSTPDPTSYYPQQQYAYYPAESTAYPAVDQSLMLGSAYSTGMESPQEQPKAGVPDALSLPTKLPEINVEGVLKRLKQRLESIQEIHNAHLREQDSVSERLQDAALSSTNLRDTQGDVSGQYNFFQEMRGYVRDLVECLDEKVPLINGLETAMLNLFKNRANQLLQRRQLDIKDQSAEFTGMSHKAAAGANMNRSEKKAAREDEEARQRRSAEREARRARRRRARKMENQFKEHNDGTSSDDEVTDSMLAKFKTEKERIVTEQSRVFEDVEDEFCSLPAIIKRFQRWKFSQGDSYSDAYIGLCLPKLCEPFIRLELLCWNPLEANCKDIESYPWYDTLMFYGFRNEDDYDREDDDIKLIPRIIEKVVLPKLSDLLENVWDPTSTLQTHRLIDIIHQLAQDYPTVSADNKNTQLLLKSVVMRIRRTLDDDVYMPLFPADMLENKASGANSFMQRQFWSCLKLLGNLLSWHGLVAKEQLLELAIDGLLNRYLLLSLNNSDIDETSIAKCDRIVSSLPVPWFEELEGDSTLRQLEPLCKYLKYAAGHIQSQAKADNTDKKNSRFLVKLIIKQLVNMRAMDHALKLTDDISLKDIKQIVTS